MKTEDILAFENNAGGEIHLVKDRLFWQAWERSAFLFSKIFRKYPNSAVNAIWKE